MHDAAEIKWKANQKNKRSTEFQINGFHFTIKVHYDPREKSSSLTLARMASIHSKGLRNMATTRVPSMTLRLPIFSSWNQCLYLVNLLLTGMSSTKQSFKCLQIIWGAQKEIVGMHESGRMYKSSRMDVDERSKMRMGTYSYIQVVPEFLSPMMLMALIPWFPPVRFTWRMEG